MRESKTRYILFILLQSLLYGVGNPVTKVAYQSITPLWLLAGRFFVTSIVYAALFHRRIRAQLAGVGAGLWLPPALCCAGAYISCNLALDLAPATTVGFLISLPVLFTPILTAVVSRRPYELRRLPVQLALTVGLFLLCCGESGFSFGAGEALGLFDAFCLAGALVFGERALRRIDAAVLSSLQAMTTFVISAVGALLFDELSVLPHVRGDAWCVVLYLALGCTVLAYLLQNHAVAHLSAGMVSMLQCTQPILTAVISFLLLGETIAPTGFLGGGMILLALLFDGWREGRRNSPSAPEKDGISGNSPFTKP